MILVMNPFEELKTKISEIESKLEFSFSNKDFLLGAFIHPSFANEYRFLALSHNERMEFLGDAVFQLLISEDLFQNLQSETEGTLSFLRSCIVCSAFCTQLMIKMDLDQYILLGKGEQQQYKRGKESILANTFEAIIGAIFLDTNYDEVKKWFFQLFRKEIDEIIQRPIRNYKAELQHMAQKYFRVQPIYEVVKEEGPGHEKRFHIEVFVSKKKVGEGTGASKKEAQQRAAKEALENLGKELNLEREE